MATLRIPRRQNSVPANEKGGAAGAAAASMQPQMRRQRAVGGVPHKYRSQPARVRTAAEGESVAARTEVRRLNGNKSA